jgi:hypothetical protein
MAEIIMRMEYIVGGSIALALASILLYIALSRLLSGIFVKHWLVFIDSEGKVKEIIPKTLKRGKTSVKHKKNEYCIDPTHKYHILAYDEKNELRIRKDGTLDSLIKAKTVEEYELAAFSMLSRLLQSKLRAVDMVMLMMLGIVLVAVLFGFMQGHR